MFSGDHQRYFIALLPPAKLLNEIHSIKETFKDKYQSKAALNSPPHITLHMPFIWKIGKESRLLDELATFATGRSSFHLSLQNFSCFPPRVIYLDVLPSSELILLQRELHRFVKINLNLFNAQYKDLPFHPHITLAFRDLKKNQFELAWKEFETKTFSAEFTVDKITLLKHNGHNWERFKDFVF